MNRRKLVTAVALVGFIFPMVNQAGHFSRDCRELDLSEFLGAQGSRGSNFFPGPPPSDDILGWGDAGVVTFGISDYAGVWNENHGGIFGTEVEGHVLECPQGRGLFTVKVVLETEDSIAFAQSFEDLIANDFDFNNTDTIFGEKPADVVNEGLEPALGESKFRISFTVDKRDESPDLPDLLDLIDNSASYAPVKFDIRITAEEERDDDTEVCLIIRQTAATDNTGSLRYTEEVVEVIDGECDDDES